MRSPEVGTEMAREMKHRHKWKLIYTDAGTCGRGLLYICEDCECCLEFSKKKPNWKKIVKAYEERINSLLK